MGIIVREYIQTDIPQMLSIWNEVVDSGTAFPQLDCLDFEQGKTFFASQTCCAVAVDEKSGAIPGMYILHPNNIGRCASHLKRKLCSFKQISWSWNR